MDKIKTVRGNFIWKDGITGGLVVFEPCENGKFLCANIPKKNK